MSPVCTVTALVLSSLLAAGCALEPEEAVEEAEFHGDLSPPYEPMEGPITGNGLSPVHFWAPGNQQALRTLGAGALLGGAGALLSTPLLDTPDGRSVLAHAARCALPSGVTLTSADGAAFAGSLALAPDWLSRGLTVSEQRWVTACLLQALNGLGVTVPILLEGAHAALDPSPGEDYTDYTIRDTTTFGNIFAPIPVAYVCVDPVIELSCGVGWSTYTLDRLCGLTPTCGMIPLTLCGLFCDRDANGDPACWSPLGSYYPQAISSKLEQTGFISLYPLCDP